jgi:hypothetical protein
VIDDASMDVNEQLRPVARWRVMERNNYVLFISSKIEKSVCYDTLQDIMKSNKIAMPIGPRGSRDGYIKRPCQYVTTHYQKENISKKVKGRKERKDN